ncbi:cytochrome P450 / NADPH-cytochrome P450 reductase [Trichoderma asperellum]
MGYAQRLKTKLKGQNGDNVLDPGINKAVESPQRRESKRETKAVNGFNIVEIPKPKGLPVIGILHKIDFEYPLASLLEIIEPLGPICQFSIGGELFIFVQSAELVTELCDESRFHKIVAAELDKLRYVVHDGLFTAKNDERNWAIAHRILMPVFGTIKIRDMFPEMKDLAQQLCLKWARYGEDYVIDVTSDFTRLALDTIGLCAMGYRFNSFHNEVMMHPFVHSMVRILKESSTQASLPQFVNSVRKRSWHRYEKDTAYMRELCRKIIQERKQQKGSEYHDLLGALLEGRDRDTGEGLSDDSIIDNMITFLIAGHETTAGLLSFTFYYFMKNPQAMEKARQEVDEVSGGDPITVQHLSKLAYLNAALKESLRLQPTAPGFILGSDKDEVIGGKYLIPANVSVTVILSLLHQEKAVYGDDASEFKPERMLDENFNKLPPNAWKPFGNGMRGCIGRAFATQEALLIIAMLLQNFVFEMADPTYELQIRETLTIKPENFKLKAKLRRGGNATDLQSELQSSGTKTKGVRTDSAVSITSAQADKKDKKPLTILFGSNSGTCEALAYRLASDAALHGFYARRIAPMNAACNNLPKSEPVIILAASYDGSPSDNAVEFFEWLNKVEPDSLKGVSYTVFGCGHRDWVATFQRIPILIDDLLEKAGADRFADRGLADAAVMDLFVELEKWTTDVVWPAISQTEGGGDGGESRLINSLLKVEVSQPRQLRQYSQLVQATVTETRSLTTESAIGKKMHLGIQLPPGVSYHPGDHLLVLPVNPPRDVKRVLSRFHLAWDTVVRASGDESVHIPVETSMTAHELLSSYFELSQPATPRDIRVLAAAATEQKTRHLLSSLATASYAEGIHENRVSLLDLLEEFPDIPLAFGTFIALLPSLRLRTYSISSSPSWEPNHASLTFSVLDEPPTPPRSKSFLGVASNYLANSTPGDLIHVATRPVKSIFQMPTDASKVPVIMVAAGAGLAPFMGFVQERASQQRNGTELAPAALFFGCRSSHDDLYHHELDCFEDSGAVQVFRAYSREDAGSKPNTRKGYIQDALLAEKQAFLRLWNAGAKIYVCGGVRMASGVKEAVMKLVYMAEQDAASKSFTPQEWFKRFEKTRYAAEIFT